MGWAEESGFRVQGLGRFGLGLRFRGLGQGLH